MKANVSRPILLAAYAVAIAADLIQVGVLEVTTWGFLSPIDDFLDIITCIILSFLVGWHIAFLPSFLVKLIPVGNLAPTWTLAVFIATRHYWTAAKKDHDSHVNSQKSIVTVQEKVPPKILPEN